MQMFVKRRRLLVSLVENMCEKCFPGSLVLLLLLLLLFLVLELDYNANFTLPHARHTNERMNRKKALIFSVCLFKFLLMLATGNDVAVVVFTTLINSH